MLDKYINTIFEPEKDQTPCWSFCRFAYKILGKEIPNSVWDMSRIEKPKLYSVALFKYTSDIWHTAIIWPDCLHIVHAIERPSGIYILKERLNNDSLRFLKGYYVG